MPLSKKFFYFILFLLVSVIGSGCSASTEQFTTMTAAAWTAAPTTTPIKIRQGWRAVNSSNFSITLPQGWDSADVEKEGVQSIITLLQNQNNEWANSIVTSMAEEEVKGMVKFWAMDIKPAGKGHATANIIFQSLPSSGSSADVCGEVPSGYQQMGVELLDSKCGLTINTLDTARLMVRTGYPAYQSYQYFYVQGQNSWILTLSVDATHWAKYEPVFEAIGESFIVNGPGIDGSGVSSGSVNIPLAIQNITNWINSIDWSTFAVIIAVVCGCLLLLWTGGIVLALLVRRDPIQEINSAVNVVFWIGFGNLVIGILGLFGVLDIGVSSWVEIFIGLVYLVLGLFVRQRNTAALAAAIAITVLLLVGNLISYYTIIRAGNIPLGAGGSVLAFSFLFWMFRGFVAMRAMGKQNMSVPPIKAGRPWIIAIGVLGVLFLLIYWVITNLATLPGIPSLKVPTASPLSKSTIWPSASTTITKRMETGMGGVCWTREITSINGNRSQVWDKYLDSKIKKLLPLDQFIIDVVLHNPQLKDDGFVFYDRNAYLLPDICK